MLVEPSWLAAHLEDPGVVVVDMRWREDGSGRERYEQGHVPGAVFLDWTTDIVDANNETVFMLAPPRAFAEAMERAGIGDDTRVVPYADRFGSGPYRLWWACRVYGHHDVSVLDGGLDRWLAEGLPLEPGAAEPRRGARWTPNGFDGALVARADDVAGAADDPGTLVLDSRPSVQYRGRAVWFERGPVPADPDGIARTPRGDIRAGRVPWAASVPATELYRSDMTMKSPDELGELFAQAGAGPGSRAITYCGVGISAAALLFALVRAGFEDVKLYDASWEEWGRDGSRPVATG
jgi:thiosulfate/3-mercaptopyruvate sulfurtransferase